MKKKRVGILIDSIEDQCEYEICQGILNYFEKLEIKTIIIEGVHNYRQDDSNEQYIRTINVVKKSNLEGLIILSSFFLDHMNKVDLTHFINSFNNLPIVSVGEIIRNIPSVIINEDSSLESLADFLVEKKGLQNFAFMFEEKNNAYSDRRLTQILNRLKYHDIDTKNFNIHHFEYLNNKQAKKETEKLIKKSMILPEAIICYDDYIALGVIDFLQSRNINVPEDVIVTGFDDISTNNPFISKLITIKQPFYSAGLEAAKTLSMIIEKHNVKDIIPINCSNILHRPYLTTNNSLKISSISFQSHFSQSSEEFKKYVTSMINNIPTGSMDHKRILINLFCTVDGLFPNFDETIFLKSIGSHIDLNSLNVHILTSLRSIIKKSIELIDTDNNNSRKLSSIFTLTLSKINDEIINILANDSYDRDNKNSPTALGGQIMLRSESLEDLLKKLPDYLETYNFDSFYLCLYKYDFSYKSTYNRDIPLLTELVYGKSDDGVDYFNNPVTFNTQDLLPDWNILDNKQNYIFIMLFYNNVPVGYFFVNVNDNINPNHFGIVRINMETALYNILRFEESKEKLSRERNYFLSSFNNIKTKVMEIENYYDIVFHDSRGNSYLNRLGESLQGLKRTINKLFIDDEEILSMDYESYTHLLTYLSNKKIEYFIGSEELKSRDSICVKIDPFTLDYIIKKISESYNTSLQKMKLSYYDNIVLLKFIINRDNKPKDTYPEEFKQIKKVLDYCQIPFSFINDEEITTLTLNLHEKQKEDNDNSDAGSIEENKRTILLTGSDKNFISSLTEILKNKFNVISTPDIIFATEKMNLKNSISIILSDITNENIWEDFVVKEKYKELIKIGLPIIFLSGSTSRKEIVNSLKLGVIDYLQKPISSTEILLKLENYISITSINKQYFIERFEKSLMEVIDSDFSIADIKIKKVSNFLRVNYNLTPRELEVVNYMVNKLYHRQIAIKMNLSEQTVKNISHVIYKKCHVSGKTELINLITSNELELAPC